MSKAKHNLFMSLFLLLIMFANSSYALENITHNTHDHGSNDGSSFMVSPEQTGSTCNHQRTPLAPGFGDTPGTAEQHHDSNVGEDCVCDEISGASSIGFVNTGPASFDLSSLNPVLNINLYQSISLDLILLPPTA
ncbi:MAG: hypothetical protein JKY98_09655 [Gammaproteobacteria bacterium]|nr:hypothetical protein [Gammaproteobacteria bacterium]